MYQKLIDKKWTFDPHCVLPRGEKGSFDDSVVGDPCIVWDNEYCTWRMFYFAMNADKSCRTGVALSKSKEDIGPGCWTKMGMVSFTNPEDLFTKDGWHKWWVAMDAYHPNQAALIDGYYYAFFSSTFPDRRIQVAFSKSLSGAWTVVKEPILSPGAFGSYDSLFCDTPTAFWHENHREMLMFYMAYPKTALQDQPNSLYGSSIVRAIWHPGDAKANACAIVIKPKQDSWCAGWLGGFQLYYDDGWYALLNASPTPPECVSDREPAPSLGGFAICHGDDPNGVWEIDTAHSPIVHIDDISENECKAGISTNLWRHHLLITPGGNKRIYFNSGHYGTEQIYSYVERR